MAKTRISIAFSSKELSLNIETLAQFIETCKDPDFDKDYPHLTPDIKHIKKLWHRLLQEERNDREKNRRQLDTI